MPDWVEPVADYMLHEGLKNTLTIAFFAVLLSTIVGIFLGTLMTIHFRPLQALIRVYIEVWRGLPILVTIFIVYYALPTTPLVQHQFGVIQGAVIGLSLWGSAQVAEATRGAVQSIPREQHEAASALGFGWIGRHSSVILPQAFRRLLPPLVSLLANIIQNTTIASLIGVTELLASGSRQIERLQLDPTQGGNAHQFAIYGAILAAFFCISFPLTRLAILLERRLV
jgi:His/Glu/Gln/Arg/opine family amino acid ABC transporter permease subunit